MTRYNTDSSANIVIVDYGTGNLSSVKRAMRGVRKETIISSRPSDVVNADKIILPGVGHFGTAMSRLAELDLLDALHEVALSKRRPVLGICLGMELMTRSSEEGNVAGLGWLDAQMIRIDISNDTRYKIPHMGWNQVRKNKDSALMAGIDESSEFYFAHSYCLKLNDPSDILTETTYGKDFPSAIEKGNILGVQFHPEKSHDAGALLLKNFADM